MVTAKQKKTLKKFLSLAPQPENAFTYNELMGYLFGLAMTPDVLLPSEWLPAISGGEPPIYASPEQAQEMLGCLMQVYNAFISAFQADLLNFPYDVLHLKSKDYEAIWEWTFGFDEALALRPEVWEPEEPLHLTKEMANEVFSSMMVIQGFTDQQTAADIVEGLSEEIVRSTFPGFDPNEPDKTTQLHVMLLVSLPRAVDILQKYAKNIEKKRREKISKRTIPLPVQFAKTDLNKPGPCNSDKKCCDRCEEGSSNSTKPLHPVRKAKVIQGNFPQHSKKSSSRTTVFQLKISLEGARPPIWRRVQVPGSTTLLGLHTIIQHCMGWTDSHLHHFIIGKTFYALPEEEDSWQESRDESRYTLMDLSKQLQPYFHYTYDFGDNWKHRITVEKILTSAEGIAHAVLLTGKRACPPEDIGGIYSYLEFLSGINNPENEDDEQALDFWGEDFQPERFSKEDISEINAILKGLS